MMIQRFGPGTARSATPVATGSAARATQRAASFAATCGMLALLVACGGGGGGGGGSDAAPSPTGLQVNQTSLSFDVEQGNSDPAAGQIDGSITGVNEPVTLVVQHTNTGLLNASFELTGATTGRLLVTPKPWDQLSPGTYRDTIQVNACLDAACLRQVPGSPKQVSVTYTVRAAVTPAHLQLSRRGVALAMVGARSRLAQDIVVRDSTGTASNWTASSDAAWLSATGSGAAGGTLRIQASAAAVAALAEGEHLATVTVRSSNAAITQAQSVRVGLVKRTLDGVASLAEPVLPGSFSAQRLSVVVDPVMPWHYAARQDRLAIDHFYTGARLATITVPGANLTDLAISDDGQQLYALDAAANNVVVVDTGTRTVTRRITPTGVAFGGFNGLRVAFARVAGQPVLLFSRGALSSQPNTTVSPIVDADTGQARGRVFGFAGWSYTVLAPTAGPVVFAADAGVTGGGLSTTRIELTANSSGSVFGLARSTPPEPVPSGLMAFAANADGTQVVNLYYADALPKRAVYTPGPPASLAWTPLTGSPLSSLGLSSVQFGPDGRWVVITGNLQMTRYDSTGQVLKTWASGLPAAWSDFDLIKQIQLSSDGFRLLGANAFFDVTD